MKTLLAAGALAMLALAPGAYADCGGDHGSTASSPPMDVGTAPQDVKAPATKVAKAPARTQKQAQAKQKGTKPDAKIASATPR